MADVYGVNRTYIESGGVANIDPEENGAPERWVYDSYTASSLAAGSVIYVCKNLPAEARIVDWRIDHAALNGGVVLKFGTAASDACLMAYTAAATANKLSLLDDGVASTTGYEIADTTTGKKLVITASSAGSVISGVIKVAVCYTVKA